MTTDQFVLQTIEQIKMADTNEQVRPIITSFQQSATTDKVSTLLTAIENISPLECTSEQWSRLRYALMLLYKPGVPQVA
ncbi:hypothetical protein [Chitinophaga alhagiae]|uniref:hypothetical protein n=1 Tax=Chitinophaga alhagiae TaxID=2203219 RepID=UPI000E5B7F00|nr:hypothetical protein [Chitinophaga alhagiae]